MELNHGNFDDVGAGTLNGSVGRRPQQLGIILTIDPQPIEVDRLGIGAAQLIQRRTHELKIAPSAQERMHIAQGDRLALHLLQILKDLGIALVKAIDKFLGFHARHARFSCKPLRPHAVNHPKVDDFS